MKKCGGMFDFDRKSGCEADGEKHDRFVIINSSEGRETLYSSLYLLPSILSVSSVLSNKDNYYDQTFFYYL